MLRLTPDITGPPNGLTNNHKNCAAAAPVHVVVMPSPPPLTLGFNPILLFARLRIAHPSPFCFITPYSTCPGIVNAVLRQGQLPCPGIPTLLRLSVGHSSSDHRLLAAAPLLATQPITKPWYLASRRLRVAGHNARVQRGRERHSDEPSELRFTASAATPC